MNDYDIAYDAVFKICELYEKQYVSQISKNLRLMYILVKQVL